MFDELPDPIEYVGGPKCGMITFTPPDHQHEYAGEKNGRPAFATYVRCADRMIFLGYLDGSTPALERAIREMKRGARR